MLLLVYVIGMMITVLLCGFLMANGTGVAKDDELEVPTVIFIALSWPICLILYLGILLGIFVGGQEKEQNIKIVYCPLAKSGKALDCKSCMRRFNSGRGVCKEVSWKDIPG